MHEQRRRGQIDALQGLPRYYGCHFGMRSTLESDKAEYYAGWDEVDLALRAGDVPTRQPDVECLVWCGHQSPEYRLNGFQVACRDSWGKGWYVSIPRFGCSKNYRTPELAIESMLHDHGCHNVRIIRR